MHNVMTNKKDQLTFTYNYKIPLQGFGFYLEQLTIVFLNEQNQDSYHNFIMIKDNDFSL